MGYKECMEYHTPTHVSEIVTHNVRSGDTISDLQKLDHLESPDLGSKKPQKRGKIGVFPVFRPFWDHFGTPFWSGLTSSPVSCSKRGVQNGYTPNRGSKRGSRNGP